MKDEIKEILDGLNVVIKQEGSLELDFKECKKILEEVNKLTAESTEWENRTYHWQDKAEVLQEANKRLQNRNIELVLENDRLKENNKSMQVEMARVWEKLDKVKEYINTHYLNAYEPYLLNIVNGDDKNVKD